MKEDTKSGIDAASFFFFNFCLLKAYAEQMDEAIWQLKRPSGLGSGRGRPVEVCVWGGTLFSWPGNSKARTNFIKYKMREGRR